MQKKKRKKKTFFIGALKLILLFCFRWFGNLNAVWMKSVLASLACIANLHLAQNSTGSFLCKKERKKVGEIETSVISWMNPASNLESKNPVPWPRRACKISILIQLISFVKHPEKKKRPEKSFVMVFSLQINISQVHPLSELLFSNLTSHRMFHSKSQQIPFNSSKILWKWKRQTFLTLKRFSSHFVSPLSIKIQLCSVSVLEYKLRGELHAFLLVCVAGRWGDDTKGPARQGHQAERRIQGEYFRMQRPITL